MVTGTSVCGILKTRPKNTYFPSSTTWCFLLEYRLSSSFISTNIKQELKAKKD